MTATEPTYAQIKAACRAVYPEHDAEDHPSQLWQMARAREWHAAWRKVMEGGE